MQACTELGWVIREEPWEGELLGCNRTPGRSCSCGSREIAQVACAASALPRRGTQSCRLPSPGSNCTCLAGVLYKAELINAHKATLHPWRRAKYHSCCYDLLGNAISLISESSQTDSPFPSYRAVSVCLLLHARLRTASSRCLAARRQPQPASAPRDHLFPPALSLAPESSPVVTLLSH